ncbi:MAG: hypothetical protein ABIN56_09080, partial [Dokdonella sp.]
GGRGALIDKLGRHARTKRVEHEIKPFRPRKCATLPRLAWVGAASAAMLQCEIASDVVLPIIPAKRRHRKHELPVIRTLVNPLFVGAASGAMHSRQKKASRLKPLPQDRAVARRSRRCHTIAPLP